MTARSASMEAEFCRPAPLGVFASAFCAFSRAESSFLMSESIACPVSFTSRSGRISLFIDTPSLVISSITKVMLSEWAASLRKADLDFIAGAGGAGRSPGSNPCRCSTSAAVTASWHLNLWHLRHVCLSSFSKGAIRNGLYSGLDSSMCPMWPGQSWSRPHVWHTMLQFLKSFKGPISSECSPPLIGAPHSSLVERSLISTALRFFTSSGEKYMNPTSVASRPHDDAGKS
mmetsp:Transcript_67806/g.161838  ORF Transcript_67806/g.161838 Transcript_67806/m.161838 type:complete len:230 (-) Transcript_67806:100-789(-)